MTRLCEDYLVRNGSKGACVRYVGRGFVYFEGGGRLLSVRWIEAGSHPGFYEFEECLLGRSQRVLSSTRVVWDDYESFFGDWILRQGDGIVLGRADVFRLSWAYFLRRSERFLIKNFPLSDIYGTVEGPDADAFSNCLGLVERIQRVDRSVSAVWEREALGIVSNYCFWIGGCAFIREERTIYGWRSM